MFYPSIEEVKSLGKGYDRVPISLEIYMDFQTPISIVNTIKAKYQRYFLLESVEGSEKWARYTFIGFEPEKVLTVKNNKTMLHYNHHVVEQTGNPLEVIKKVMAQSKSAPIKGLPPFTGGAVGYFGYETAKYVEELTFANEESMDTPDILLMFCDKVIAFDHFRQKIILLTNMDATSQNKDESYSRATQELMEMYTLISTPVPSKEKPTKETIDFKGNTTKEAFMERVERAKEYIRAGDIFQVVLSQRFKAVTKNDLFDIYRVLRTLNPSPYMYLIKCDDLEIAGASPETLVKVKGQEVVTMPIAGTRKRGQSEEEDKDLARDLLEDEKELAEHNMLVDLARNDVGAVSAFGTVKVENYKKIEKFSHVMHMTSEVKGLLKAPLSAIDALKSILPAGTLSGAPKIRAMEIIEELEEEKRGLYGGGIGYLGYDGSMDTCITIRTLVKKGEDLFIQAGAGIVLDSDPEKEYEETNMKARVLFEAIRRVGEII